MISQPWATSDTGDELLGMEELTVGSRSDFIDYGGFQVDEDGARDVLASTGLAEERVERIVSTSDGLVRGHLRWRCRIVEGGG